MIENLQTCERAILAYQEALKVYTPERYPNPRARVMRSLGFVYAERANQRDRAENLRLAINSWKETLNVFTEASAPEDYASLQDELGSAFQETGRGRE